MTPKEYVEAIYEKSQIDDHAAREHSYRGILEHFIGTFGVKTVNEAKHRDCGAPDITVYNQNQNVIGFIETKNIGDTDLDGNRPNQNKEQFTRYKNALGNLIFTDYLDFHFYNGTEFIEAVNIGRLVGDKIVFIPENEEKFLSYIKKFTGAKPQKITSTSKLAEVLAHKAQLIRQTIIKTLSTNGKEAESFREQIVFFKRTLIHDLDEEKFADIYAQTITYGLFVARMHDNSLETFSREEAISLLPSTNPFLQEMFEFMVGKKMQPCLEWVVNDLVSVLAVSDLRNVLKTYGAQQDVVLHFYEDFLTIYDPELRKNLGVFYTPKPVVNFIVRAVDHILQNDFGLTDGIANSDKITIEKKTKIEDKIFKENVEVFKTQILDPALGTGTFLAEVIEQVYAKFVNRKAAWQSYVDECLLNRLNGFEYMMSPHTMAHIKLGNLLEETGWQNIDGSKRLNVYLTNSLEEGKIADMQLKLFAEAIAKESEMANQIKTNCPVMCVIGNPPYNDKSSNNGDWIMNMMSAYKINLGEQKTHLEDDYMKFIRLGQYYVDKRKTGIVAFITNNGYLAGISQKIMRKSLLISFDDIYILNLHGSRKIKETKPGVEENVFDIQEGVAISIFVKSSDSTKLGTVHYADVYGVKEKKLDYLLNNSLQTIDWKTFKPAGGDYYFIPIGSNAKTNTFSVIELFGKHNTGIQTSRDKLVISCKKADLIEKIKIFTDQRYSDEEIFNRFHYGDNREWNLSKARVKIKDYNHDDIAILMLYNPLDYRYIYFSNDMVDWPRPDIMPHLLRDNLALIVGRQGQAVGNEEWNLAFVTDRIVDLNVYYRGGGDVFPLYLYHDADTNGSERTPNLNLDVVKKFEQILKISFDPEESATDRFSPVDLLNYVYGILYSPRYRKIFSELLKIDYPRIPYPKNVSMFTHFASYGDKLRKLHLMQNIQVNPEWAKMDTLGSNEILEYKYKQGCVHINKEQFFENVPEEAWNFCIGGLKPAQQWLKDRKNKHPLDYNDIPHYQKIITILMETKRIMDEIDQKNYFD